MSQLRQTGLMDGKIMDFEYENLHSMEVYGHIVKSPVMTSMDCILPKWWYDNGTGLEFNGLGVGQLKNIGHHLQHGRGGRSVWIMAKESVSLKHSSTTYLWDIQIGSPSVVIQNQTTPTITGEANGKVDTSYEYTFMTTDPDGFEVSYLVDWAITQQPNGLRFRILGMQ